MLLLPLLWMIHIPLSTAPLLGIASKLRLPDPDLFICEQAFPSEDDTIGWHHSVALTANALLPLYDCC